MPEIYSWSEVEFIAFILILIRVSAFIVSWPVFFVSTVPVQVKILFSVAITAILFPIVNKTGYSSASFDLFIIWLAIKEVFVGLTLGYLARFFFYIFNIAGDIISTSMGLSGVQLLNPNFGGRSSAIEQFLAIIATLFFIAIDGHHLMLYGLSDSFRLVSIFQDSVNLTGFKNSLVLLQTISEMGIKVCAPVMVSILFMNVTMAIIGKAIPQINVLVTSLPINILLGFIVMMFSMPMLLWQMDGFLEITMEQVFRLIKTY